MANRRGTKLVRDGLLLFIDPMNSKSYVSGSSTVTDFIGTETNIATNDVVFDGKGWALDGTDDYIGDWALNVGKTYTTTAWIKSSDTNYVILGDVDINFMYWVNGSTSVGNPNGAGGSTFWTLPYPQNDGKWHTLTWTRNGTSDETLYYDGQSLGTKTHTGTAPSHVIRRYGAKRGNVGSVSFPFLGSIGPLLVYNRPLSAKEVLDNYNALKSRFGL